VIVDDEELHGRRTDMRASPRRKLIRHLAGTTAFAVISYATRTARAQPGDRRRVGILGTTTATGSATRWRALRRELSALGWIEGRTLEIVERYADDVIDRLPALCAELLAARVEVLVTHEIAGTRAARQATTAVPIVMATVADPVAAGLVASYARPGGNITGTAFRAHELAAKRLQLLKEAVPDARRVAVLYNRRNPLFGQAMLDAMQSVAPQLGITLDRVDAGDPALYPQVLAVAVAATGPDAIAITEDAAFNAHVGPLAELALRHRLPSVGTRTLCDAGGLVGYGANFNAMFERAAHFVDRLLRGARPGDLPIEQSTRFELAVNLRTAKVLGLMMPNALVVRAETLIR
jgi:putative ABC transport system substrate-binding protein